MSALQSAPRSRTGSILQLLLSLAGSGFCALFALGLLLYDLMFANSGDTLLPQRTDFLALAWIFAFLALLGLPSLWYAGRALAGRPAPAPGGKGLFIPASTTLVVWPLLLLAGNFVSKSDTLSHWVLPPLTILASIIPIWWLVELARRGLKPASPQRSWGVLNFALFFSNPAVILAEVLLVVLLLAGVVVLVMLDPGMSDQIVVLSQELSTFNADPSRLQQILVPYLSNPMIILGGLTLFSVVIPLLEELFKPLAVWALVGRGASTADGLAGGAIAGAGFALTETLFNLSSPQFSGQWVAVVVGRAGTGMLHVTTAAMIGMSIAAAWKSRQFWRVLLAYLGAVVLHGLWNGFSLSSGLVQVLLASSPLANFLSLAAVGGLLILAIAFVFILISANRRLRSGANPAAKPALSM